MFSLRLSQALDWLYPPRCRYCRESISKDEDYFCHACWAKIRLVSPPLCTRCGRPFLDAGGDDHLCGACLMHAPYFEKARSWACYPSEESEGHPLREIVQRFKYRRKVSLGKPLGRLMARGCYSFLSGCPVDLVIPVPLHPKRLRWRGFNQAVILAREVGRLWKLPVDPFILVRSRETPPQTQLAEEERRKNMRGAFSLNPAKPVDAKTILLVDDVYTSGATVNECSRTLLRAGAKEVYVLTLARTV
ncbi:MAG: ComF family protein [Deltaproteobacteria bacterium]|nr:ComF family protein [Deltaproteobacteria bacterium]